MGRMTAGKRRRESHSDELVDMQEGNCAVCIGMVRRRIVPLAWLLALLMTAGVRIDEL